MCLKFLLKVATSYDYTQPFQCSCEICEQNFTNMELLIKHMGSHDTRDLNARLRAKYGTVRCNSCFRSFESVYNMRMHPCVKLKHEPHIRRITSTDSVILHDII
jgi:hypothetical protein